MSLTEYLKDKEAWKACGEGLLRGERPLVVFGLAYIGHYADAKFDTNILEQIGFYGGCAAMISKSVYDYFRTKRRLRTPPADSSDF